MGDVTLNDRYWSRGGYPPLSSLVPLDEKEHFHPDVNPYFDERFLYGHIRKRGWPQPMINLAFPAEENNAATFQRLQEIITSTTPSGPDLGDPL